MALGAGETTLLRMVTGLLHDRQWRQADQADLRSTVSRTATAGRFGEHDERDCADCAAREWSNQEEPELVDDRKQVIDPMTAYQILNVMEGVIQRGTAQKLRC